MDLRNNRDIKNQSKNKTILLFFGPFVYLLFLTIQFGLASALQQSHFKEESPKYKNEILYFSKGINIAAQDTSFNMNLIGTLNLQSNYGDIWGYTDANTGKEYALLCVRNEGLSIIDITDDIPVEVGFEDAVNPGIDSKDVKVYDHYAILINEKGPVQIIDIAKPADPVTVATIDLPNGSGAHNAYVDGKYLYIIGENNSGGILIYDMSTPTKPIAKGTFTPFYYHDIYVRNDTVFAAGIRGDGIDIIDVSDKDKPFLIANFNYPGSGAHNVWTTEDGKYIFVGDEIGSGGNHTRVFDIRDFANIEKVSDIIVDPEAIAHNCYVKGDLLYIAHYTEGLRVFNVADPVNPVEVAYYDTYPAEGYGFLGCWSVYPFFASGKIIASDMQSGLFVLQLDLHPTNINKEETSFFPKTAHLAQNYPNPFNPSTTIAFSLPTRQKVELKIYNMMGQEIDLLLSEMRNAGNHKVKWNANGISGGIYFYQLKAGSFVQTKKFILLK